MASLLASRAHPIQSRKAGGVDAAAKQALDAAKFIADRLANLKVRKPSLKAVLHRAPTTTEVERDTQFYLKCVGWAGELAVVCACDVRELAAG